MLDNLKAYDLFSEVYQNDFIRAECSIELNRGYRRPKFNHSLTVACPCCKSWLTEYGVNWEDVFSLMTGRIDREKEYHKNKGE